MRRGVDWSVVAARDAIDGCPSGELPGPFAALARNARGQTSVVGVDDDFWASVREDVPHGGHGGAGCAEGSCRCSSCKGAEVVDSFWAPSAGATRRPTNARPSKGQTQGRGTSERGRIASQSGPQTQEEREASAEVEQTNAVIATGNPKIIEAWLAARDSGDLEATRSFWERYGDEVWGAPLVHLEPPEDGGGCVDKLKFDSNCNLLAFDITKDLPDLDEYATRDVPIDFHDEREDVTGCDASLEGLIRAGWSFLQDNLDLVDWARCWVFGEGLDGEANLACLHRMITGDGYFEGSVDIYARSGTSPFGDSNAADGWWIISLIYLYPEIDFWQRRLTNWCCATDNATRACMAMSAAALLLHELVHYCGRVRDTKGHTGNCARSYLIQSVFWWALLRRYPDAGAGKSCCAELLGVDEIFADGRKYWDVGHSCDPQTC